MSDRVSPLDVGARWEPNAPDAVLVSNDAGDACLALEPHVDDEDRRVVVLRWSGCASASMGAPNDEARHTHALYDAGLRDVLWAGEVADSSALRRVASAVHRAPRHHYIVLLKEGVVEVLADEWQLLRFDGPTSAAASAGIVMDR